MSPPLDFPSSPATGATYAGGNGVVYTFNGTVWLASGASAGGDFYATNSANLTLAVSATLIVLNTVKTGNAGGWYSSSTGRFTPPAGRYFISVQLSCSNAGAAVTVTTELRKNGVLYAYNIDGAPTGLWAQPSVHVTVDSNGTDYWELWGNSNSSSTSASGHFTAFPVSGIKGPPGDPGVPTWTTLGTAVGSGQTFIDFTGIPSTINHLDLRYYGFIAHGATAGVQVYRSGVLDTSTSYFSIFSYFTNTGSTVTAGQGTTASWSLNGNQHGSFSISGRIHMPGIQTTGEIVCDLTCQGVDATNSSRIYITRAGAINGGPLTGLRIFVSTGTIVSGRFTLMGCA